MHKKQLYLHDLDEHAECLLLGHLHEQQPDDERRSLAVAHLPVVDGVRLHHVEQSLLPHAVLLLEEVVLGVRARNVSGKKCSKELKGGNWK